MNNKKHRAIKVTADRWHKYNVNNNMSKTNFIYSF